MLLIIKGITQMPADECPRLERRIIGRGEKSIQATTGIKKPTGGVGTVSVHGGSKLEEYFYR
jgi:hypothetical protein